MDPESTEIQANNIINRYKNHPHIFENYCLADFASKVQIVNSKNENVDTEINEISEQISHNVRPNKLLAICNGTEYRLHKKQRIIRYVNYNKKTNSENHYRERLMLFMPWRDENVDLLCGYNTYEESYTENQQLIVPLHKQYENFNDVIEESKETQDVTKYDDDQDDIDDSNIMECLSMIDKYGFYYPDRDENLKTYDLATDIKQLKNRQHIKHDSYDPNVDSSGYNMSDEEYTNVMRSLNK